MSVRKLTGVNKHLTPTFRPTGSFITFLFNSAGHFMYKEKQEELTQGLNKA